MNPEHWLVDLTAYFFIYAFAWWGIEVICTALRDGHYVNCGLLNLPFSMTGGYTSAILLLTLPTLDGHPVYQLCAVWVIAIIVKRLTEQFVKNVSHRSAPEDQNPPWKSLCLGLAEAAVYLCIYLLVHPFVYGFINWMPDWSVTVFAVIMVVLTVVDYLYVRHALRVPGFLDNAEGRKAKTQRMANKMTERVWKRLEKAYPGIRRTEPDSRNTYVFAKGICFDKLVWVFLVSAFLGALIEMVFCRVTAGQWMNRSSVLYGTFSVVWGLGAVVLTVVLQRLAGKEDRKVFLAGFVVGGVYEYLCSVFTEIVFGTVFWDYSHLPLNIGGRINVLYCLFWGLLAVMWLKVLFPPMDRAVEKIPPLPGKILTWTVVAVMLFDGLLTAGAMCRYTARQTDPEPGNIIEAFLDERYDDDFMESRWPNMKIAE